MQKLLLKKTGSVLVICLFDLGPGMSWHGAEKSLDTCLRSSTKVKLNELLFGHPSDITGPSFWGSVYFHNNVQNYSLILAVVSMRGHVSDGDFSTTLKSKSHKAICLQFLTPALLFSLHNIVG